MQLDPVSLVSDSKRLELSRDLALGAGNFLAQALINSPAPDEPILILEKSLRTFWGETFESLSLNELERIAEGYAGWYAARGVRAQDPIFIYLDDGVEYLIHYLALTRVGAIGVLTNGNMPASVAAAHARNVGVVGIVTDESHLPLLSLHLGPEEFGFTVTARQIEQTGAKPEDLPKVTPHRYDAEDPVMIAHSSGTTGIPKAVLLQHERFFYGVRYRLGVPRVKGGERILSSLPHSHNCAIAYLMLALLSGTPVYVASDHTGAGVLNLIQTHRPNMVVSFPQTYVEMTECDLDAYDLSSVSLWFNGGDAAHESHIRALVQRGTLSRDGVRVPGSVFIDGMGSSEMGFSLFRHVHTSQTNHYNRCVGKPLEWVDAQILTEEGEKLPPHQVGRLGVRAPSVTSGYWNNSLLTYRSRLAGYFLTGDLAYRDEDGFFYHVDRVPDVIVTREGPVYGLQTEEALLSRFAGIADCAVYGERTEGADFQLPIVAARIRSDSELAELDEQGLLALFNNGLLGAGLRTVSEVRIVSQPEVPLGTTGKVLKRVLRTSALPQESVG